MTGAQVNPIPDGMHTITPHLICADAADAIDFYQRAFGAAELSRLATPDGQIMHAQIRIGDSTVMLMDEAPRCLAYVNELGDSGQLIAGEAHKTVDAVYRAESRRLGQTQAARDAYETALALAGQAQERRFVERRLHELAAGA